jgi:hypothetical protein
LSEAGSQTLVAEAWIRSIALTLRTNDPRAYPKLLDALGAEPAGVFLFANNKMRNNPDQIELGGSCTIYATNV